MDHTSNLFQPKLIGTPELTLGLSPNVVSYVLTCECENDTFRLILEVVLFMVSNVALDEFIGILVLFLDWYLRRRAALLPLVKLLLLELRHDFNVIVSAVWDRRIVAGVLAEQAVKGFDAFSSCNSL